MGVIDIEGKRYLSDNSIFADAFNYLLYGGDEVIKADELQELDTTQIAIPYGNGARIPMQKHRDLLKLWSAMTDGNIIYVILGGEVQDRVHYGMPVRDGLYDMIGYTRQIEEIRRSYKKQSSSEGGTEAEKNADDAEMFIEDGMLKIKLTSDEFLSGMRKGDKLIPIVTAVIYLSPEPWDGPLSLFDMLDVKDERLYPFLNDYKLNLIAPASIEDADFDKFHTEFGLAMKVLKYQNDDADRIIEETDHKLIGSNTAVFLNRVANLGLEFEEEGGKVDMCAAMEKRSQKDKVSGVIEGMKLMGASENDIINKVMETYNVTKEYVLALLAPKTA